MYLGDGDFSVHVLCKEVLKEARICPTQNAAVMWVELDVNNLLSVILVGVSVVVIVA